MPDMTPAAASRPVRRSRRLPTVLAVLAILVLGTGLLGACGDDDESLDTADGATEDAADAAADIEEQVDEVGDQIDDVAAKLRENDLETLASAVESLDVTELTDGRTFTLFAPTDDAFLSLTSEETTDLLTDPAMLLEVLESHLADETITSADLAGMDSVTTRTGAVFDVTVDGETIMVGDATVTNADITVGDGVIHVIDAVLMP